MNVVRSALAAAGVVMALGAVVAFGTTLVSAPTPRDPMGWVPVESAVEVPARTGKDAARDVVLAELTAATAAAGVGGGAPDPVPQGATADCVASWTGVGSADEAGTAALEAALEQRGWRVTARREGPVPGTRLDSGPWSLELGNGGLLDTLSLLARRHDPACDEAYRRDAATRAPHEG
ncbi:hypothetical protein [Streptomyces sp. NPDC048606]|uniref:hypothetical protein n=1 Tax=Streptomyces sp. NPDC048606 TaxID=3154726 RepID=UPI003417CAF6